MRFLLNRHGRSSRAALRSNQNQRTGPRIGPQFNNTPEEALMNTLHTLRWKFGLAATCASALLLSGCGGDDNDGPVNVIPSFVGTITKTSYDGVADIPTAGLGKSGLPAAAWHRRPDVPDGRGIAPAHDLQQLPRARRRQ
jgi:hypothetical protein